MPFECAIPFRRITEPEFKRLDFEVMKHAFASHNDLGRLCDEAVYRNDLAARLGTAGIDSVCPEVPLVVSHRDYRKRYFLDLAVGNAIIYELKAVSILTGDHNKQVLTYLLVAGASRGKIVNFGPASVEYRTVNSVLTREEQRRYELVTKRWLELDNRSIFLRQILTALLDDWGVFLALSLYEDALTHFLGGEGFVLRRVPLTRAGIRLGHQAVHHLAEDTGFKLTAFADSSAHGESHVRRLLALTSLRRMHWINFAHHRIELVTLEK